MEKYSISPILVRLRVDIFYPIIYEQKVIIIFRIINIRISAQKSDIFHHKIQ